MKKYMCYILPVVLLLPIAGALGVWSQKNNLQIGLRKTADGEFDVIGDSSAIKNLSYQFMVTDDLNVWQVTGKGDTLKAAYAASDVLRDQTNTVDIQISPVFDEHIKQNSIENPNFDQPSDMEITYMIAGVEDVSYRLSLFDPLANGENKQKDIAFEVRWKKDKLGSLIQCDYFDNDPKGSLSCSLPSPLGDDLYQNARETTGLTCWSVDEHGYFIVSPLQFLYDFSQVTFDQNPGGIYRSENGKSRRIVSLPLGKQDILGIVSTEKNVTALVMEKKELYLYTYDSSGKQLDRSDLHTALPDIAEPVLQLDQQDHILFGYMDGFDYVAQVYEQKNGRLKQIDSVKVSVGANSSAPVQQQYDQGVLYCMQEGSQTIRILAANHKGMLYRSEVYGDYQEDDLLGYLDLNKGLSYENIIQRYLFDGKRYIVNMKLLSTR